jgi:hypothetical protein
MINLPMSTSYGASALLLCGSILLLTAVVHMFVTFSPLQTEERCIFLRPRSVLSRWLTGDMAPGFSLLIGMLIIMLTTFTGVVAQLNGHEQAMIVGPVPGVLLAAWSIVASLRHLEENGLVKVLLSVATSLLLLMACALLLLVVEGM